MRREFKITAIKGRIEFCESERRQVISMVTRSSVNLAWISKCMGSIEKELRLPLPRSKDGRGAGSEE